MRQKGTGGNSRRNQAAHEQGAVTPGVSNAEALTGVAGVPGTVVTNRTIIGDNDGSVSSMQTADPEAVRHMTCGYLEEQALLGNMETSTEMKKRVGDFTRAYVFQKIKFIIHDSQMDSTDKLATFVTHSFVRERNADSVEETARRRVVWWSTYKNLVHSALGRRRAEAMSNVKKAIIGM